MSQKKIAEGIKTVNPAAYCVKIARNHVDIVSKREPRKNDDMIIALIFTAFALEGAMNVIGKFLEPDCWVKIEKKKRFKEKIKYLYAKIFNENPDWENRPLKTIDGLIDFRNRMAHAKEDSDEQSNIEVDSAEDMRTILKVEFEKYLTPSFVNMAFKDVEQLSKQMYAEAGCGPPEDYYGPIGIDHGPFGSLGTETITTTPKTT